MQIGDIVRYKLSADDVDAIVKRRDAMKSGPMAYGGGPVFKGQILPAMVTALHDEFGVMDCVVQLNGTDTLWSPGVCKANDFINWPNGFWSPVRRGNGV